MLYPIDKNGCAVHRGRMDRIQKQYRLPLQAALTAYKRNLKGDLTAVYVRGSVSVGRAIPGLSDIDCVAITKREISPKKLRWVVGESQKISKAFSINEMVELQVVPERPLLKDPKYLLLRVNLKTRSVRLYGKDVVAKIKPVRPGAELSRQYLRHFNSEVRMLNKIFSGDSRREYLFEKRPTQFWCRWAMRELLRAGIGLVMISRPLFTSDLPTCKEVTAKYFPRLKKMTAQALKWEQHPIKDARRLQKFFNESSQTLISIWQEQLKK